MLPYCSYLNVLGRAPCGATARRPEVTAIHMIFRVGIIIKAIPFGQRTGCTNSKSVTDRDVDHSADALTVIISDFGFKIPVEGVILRLHSNHINDAAGGIASVKSPLRTAQDFHALHIEIFLLEQPVSDKRSIVEADGNSGISRNCQRFGSDTAN